MTTNSFSDPTQFQSFTKAMTVFETFVTFKFYKGFLQRGSTFCRTRQSSWTTEISSPKSHTSMLRGSKMLSITVSWSEYDHTNQWPLRRKRVSYDKSEKQFASVAQKKEIWFVCLVWMWWTQGFIETPSIKLFKALPFPNVFFWLFPKETETDLRNIPFCTSKYILHRTPRTLVFSTKQPLWWRHLPRLSQPLDPKATGEEVISAGLN